MWVALAAITFSYRASVAQPCLNPTEQPDTLGTIIGLIGLDATFVLLETAAGTRIYIPESTTGKTNLSRIIGELQAAILAKHFGGDHIDVPLAKAWRVKVYHERGLSYPKIARLIGCNESTVFKYLRRMGLTVPRQAPADDGKA